MTSWAFSQLNQLSPESSPTNGPGSDLDRNDSSLSFPVSGTALQAQLEAWTNVAFDFDSSSDFAGVGALDGKGGDEREYYSAGLDSYSLGLGDDSFTSLLGVDPLLDPFAPLYGPPSAVDNSLLVTASPPAAAAPPAAPVLAVRATKVNAPKKRRASSSVGSAPPETPAPDPAAAPEGDDELNSVAVEEDKRRRNTAASGQSTFVNPFRLVQGRS